MTVRDGMKKKEVKNIKWTSHQRSGSWLLWLTNQSSGCSDGSGRRRGRKAGWEMAAGWAGFSAAYLPEDAPVSEEVT